MNRFLTFTGADDSVGQSKLFEISDKNPFVEWGILISAKRAGNPRFPSSEWIDELAIAYYSRPLAETKPNFSLHVCGKLVRDFLIGNDIFPDLGGDVFDMFNRIQINTHGEEHKWDQPLVIELLKLYSNHEFIFQLDGNGKNEAMAKILVLEHGLKNVSFLFDRSHGAGIHHGVWTEPQTERGSYGYAGGLGPDNIGREISKIVSIAGMRQDNKCGIWIDMETKVRTWLSSGANDIFDIGKVEQVIDICRPWFVSNSAHGFAEGSESDDKFIISTATATTPTPSKFKQRLSEAMAEQESTEKGHRVFPAFDPLNMVAEFHRLFDHPILDTPMIPSESRCDLRKNLIFEEAEEFAVAIKERDIVAVADALADLMYVVAGAVHEFGLSEKFAAIMYEVHRSNMSKACTGNNARVNALRTISKYKEENPNEEYHEEERNGAYFVYRTRDKKTVKSINYSPADIFKILHE